MSVIDDYLASLSGNEKQVVGHMYSVVRRTAPGATEEVYYAMPAFKYQGKGLVAIMVHGQFLSLYAFCSVDRLRLDLSGFDATSGSIHFTIKHPIPDDLLREIITARVRLITA